MAYSLKYSYNSSSQSYSVSGYSNITTSDKVVIPNTYNNGTNGSHPVTSIGKSAFRDCSSLTSIKIGNSVTSIGDMAFYNCSSLASITIPNSVTSIGHSAFYNCSSLTSVTVPNGVTSIGSSVFYGCSSLTSIKIGNSVTSIGSSAFEKCSSLTSITIPNSVTSIGNYAFRNCSKLTSVTVPNGVTSIGSSVFYGCSSLTSVTVPNSIKSIGSSAFEKCSSLTSITIPDSVTSIGNYAFYDCSSLTSVTIPDSVTSIGNYAFYRCSSLKQLILFPSTPPTLGSSAIPSTISKIYVQQSSKAAYQAATNWNGFTGKIAGDSIYLSFVRFNQKNKEYINEKISESTPPSVNVVQTTGNSTNDVMSQKAVTNNFLPVTTDEDGIKLISDQVQFNSLTQFRYGCAINNELNFMDNFQYRVIRAPAERGRMAVEPDDLPTETALVTVSSTGTHAYKKVSELVDTTSAQTLTGKKTWGTKNSNFYTIAEISTNGVSVEAGGNNPNVQVSPEAYNRLSFSSYSILQSIKKAGEGTEYNTVFSFPTYDNQRGEYYFSMTPKAAPTEPSVVVNAADRTPTWKPLSELEVSVPTRSQVDLLF